MSTPIRLLLLFIVTLPLALVAAGQAGWLQGAEPEGLGVRDGRLRPPSESPNSVSSQAALYPQHPRATEAAIEPLALVGEDAGDGQATLAQLRNRITQMPGAEVVSVTTDYLYARFHTRWLGFVDDAEFWFDPQARVVQVRSASRVGRSDLGVNRDRIEALRDAMAR
jgi:uncharacterized protein (DUF1499 family)